MDTGRPFGPSGDSKNQEYTFTVRSAKAVELQPLSIPDNYKIGERPFDYTVPKRIEACRC